MKKLVRIVRRMKYAGWRNAARVISTRLYKKVAHSSLGQRFFFPVRPLDEAAFLGTIDFGEFSHGDLVSRFVTKNRGFHFLDDFDESATLAQEHFPDGVKNTIAAADAVCRHEFSFLGKDARFAESIDWHWCPESRGSWPVFSTPAYEGPRGYDAPDRPGDVKYPWELNRHQYFVTLAKAYLYEQDERYVREVADQMLDWIEKNPYMVGMNWSSTMEVGIRLISWMNAYWLLKESPYFQEHALEACLRSMVQHAQHLNANLTTDWLVPTNHIIGETAALFAFGSAFPSINSSPQYCDKALRIFTREIEGQVYADGVNKEQATGYHRFVVDFILLVIRNGELNNLRVPQILYDRLGKMLEYESHLVGPNGSVPQVGDCDDGRGFILSESVRFFDYSGWQTAGAALLNRAAESKGNEETLWFLGAKEWERIRFVEQQRVSRKSRLFPDGGQAILHTGEPATETYVHIRCGTFGLGGEGACGHSHGDMLSPVIFWRGDALSVDAGTFSYLCEVETRDLFRSSAMHNTLAPRGVNQGELKPQWDWGKVPITKVTKWHAGDGETVLSAELDAAGEYTHRRTIRLQSDPLALTIEDSIQLAPHKSATDIDWMLHLAPDLDAVISEREIVISRSAAPIVILTFEGFDEATVQDRWHSPSYGVRQRSRSIRLSKHAQTLSTTVHFRPFEA